jgi:hypothetical protein
MRANCYLDFETVGGGEDMPHYAALAKAFHVLHGAFGGSNGRYAVAFPKSSQLALAGDKPNKSKGRSLGNVIRVFASSSADLYELIEKVKGHHVMRDYARVSMPKDVPADFKGKWISWRRIRVQKKDGPNRDETLLRAQASPFFEIPSSSRNVFPLRFRAYPAGAQVCEFTPSSYGLAAGGNRDSRFENVFSLPVL